MILKAKGEWGEVNVDIEPDADEDDGEYMYVTIMVDGKDIYEGRVYKSHLPADHNYPDNIKYFHDSGWECPESPVGTCMYDSVKDPAYDNCLICGEPYERK